MFIFGTAILAFFILVWLIAPVFHRCRPALAKIYHRIQLRLAYRPKDIRQISSLLETKVPYFSTLTEKGKNKFAHRLLRFMNYRSFETRDGMVLTQEMKVLVSASAVQLTFGLRQYMLPRFTHIIIRPDIYYFASREEYHKGTTTGEGAIILSWKHFMEGNLTGNDGVNLGLHEMTHALQLEYELGRNFDIYFAGEYEKFEESTRHEFENVVTGKSSFFRDYAAVNAHEFFAVCVENFFERPAEMLKLFPALYTRMCLLLRQDPLNAGSDYLLLTENILGRSTDPGAVQEVLAFRNRISHRPWQWSTKLSTVGLISAVVLYNLYNFVIIPFSHLLLFIGCASLAAFLIQYRYFRINMRSGGFFYVLFCISGVGINLITLLLAINFIFRVGPVQHQYFPGVWSEVKTHGDENNQEREISIDVSHPRRNLTFSLTLGKEEIPRCDSIVLNTQMGLLGYPVILETGVSVDTLKN